jgi:MFS family permease
MQGVGFAAVILGAVIVYVVMGHFAGRTDVQLGDYRPVFYIGGVAAMLAAVAFFSMKLHGAHVHRSKLVIRKRYWLYYVLALLFGARKQLFITFGPWVLIKIFHEPAQTIAVLWIVGSSLQVFFQPFLGRMIDRWGERTILLIDSLVLTFICAGYAGSHLVANPSVGLWILYVCFVGDMMMFGVNMARQTYAAKLADSPADVSPTLSMGVTLDHAVSMSLPWLGGWVWEQFGHSVLFVSAAGVAVLMATFSAMIPNKEKLHALEQQHNAGRT